LLQNANWVNLQSGFCHSKKMYNVTIFFRDRTNVRSKLLLLGHLPNLVGHCPMSDSNLQPCMVEKTLFKNFFALETSMKNLTCICYSYFRNLLQACSEKLRHFSCLTVTHSPGVKIFVENATFHSAIVFSDVESFQNSLQFPMWVVAMLLF
jgi:hypothetical protein